MPRMRRAGREAAAAEDGTGVALMWRASGARSRECGKRAAMRDGDTAQGKTADPSPKSERPAVAVKASAA